MTRKESDPNGKSAHEPGAKLDDGKPDCSLLQSFGMALLAVAVVATFGARKYTRNGWKQVPDGFARYTAAMLRHIFKEEHEGPIDRDSGLLHAAHIAWNALARLEFLLQERPEYLADAQEKLVAKPVKSVVALPGQLELFQPST